MARIVGISKSSVQRAWSLVDDILEEDRQYRRQRQTTASSTYRSDPQPTYSPEQLARARKAHTILQIFIGQDFASFCYFLLDGGERTLGNYERAAAAFERYEAKHGLLGGKKAHSVGWKLVSISFGQLVKPVDVPPTQWQELLTIYEAELPSTESIRVAPAAEANPDA